MSRGRGRYRRHSSGERWADHYFKLWQVAIEAAKLALADNERVYQNTGHNALSYETREALRQVVEEGGNNG